VTGFIGADPAGRTTTLGRGGSDYSASIVGAALRASAVEIWTDVNGVLTGPPRLLPNARTVPELTYEEAAELAFFGAKVLHRDTMRPLAALGIPIAVRNTFGPAGGATRISGAPPASHARSAAVTAVEDVDLLIAEPGDRQRGTSHGIRTELAEAGLEPLAWAQVSAGGTVSVVVPAAVSDRAVAALRRNFLVDRRGGLSLVAVVGHGLGRQPAFAAAALTALLATRTPVIALWTGASTHSLAALVERRDLSGALGALHERVVISGDPAESRGEGADAAGARRDSPAPSPLGATRGTSAGRAEAR
jgi:aspartate kinase